MYISSGMSRSRPWRPPEAESTDLRSPESDALDQPGAPLRRTIAGLTGLALALFVATGALGRDEPRAASTGGSDGTKICPPGRACTLLNGFAAPARQEPMLRTYAEALEDVRPAAACPQVTEAYSEAGLEIDGVLGPCPAHFDAGEAAQAVATAAAVDHEIGGSR
jgi:hypothetical protein